MSTGSSSGDGDKGGFFRQNGLGLVFGALFLLSLLGQAVAGVAEFNEGQLTGGYEPVSFWAYLTTSDFAADVTENWQSEYLQFVTYVFATVWFLQRGSPESKELDKNGTGSDEEQKVGAFAEDTSPRWARIGGWRTTLYSHSLVTVVGLIFLASWAAQSISGQAAYNVQQMQDLQDPVSWLEYLARPDFWSRTFQNWQSEFLAVGSMAVLSIYLRQRGSSESKPVGEAHDATGVSG
ncbi:MAG: DUF6766 family protein [Actinomycetes bacterium]